MSEQPQQFQHYEPRQEATVFDDTIAETQLDLHMNTVPKYDVEAIRAMRAASERNAARTDVELQAERILKAGQELKNLQAARRAAQGLDTQGHKAA